mgnify:FL=1
MNTFPKIAAVLMTAPKVSFTTFTGMVRYKRHYMHRHDGSWYLWVVFSCFHNYSIAYSDL